MANIVKVAIIGSGISGLGAAQSLKGHADITLFEAGSYFGGHAHTVDLTLPTPQGLVTCGIDTGFLVYNDRTYPQLIALFAQLGVPTAASEMSFSVQVPGAHAGGALEWSGNNLSSVFAQRSNLWNPRFLGMLWDMLRFNKLCTAIALQRDEASLRQPLGDFISEHGFRDAFCNWYLLPMLGCIWSCPTDQMLAFPVSTMIRFCHNHGLLQVTNRPQWRTVTGGSRQYVNKIVETIADKRLNTPVQRIERHAQGVRIIAQDHSEHFDKVIIATHAPQALALLDNASEQERTLLGTFRTQQNKAVLHTDTSVLPKIRSTWAAWNYERGSDTQEQGRVCLHYLINKLQPIPFDQAVVVSLNPTRPIEKTHVIREFDYEHPVFDAATAAAQQQLSALQGKQHTYFCGAWTGYGFHEDGLTSGLAVARQLLYAMQAANPLGVSAT